MAGHRQCETPSHIPAWNRIETALRVRQLVVVDHVAGDAPIANAQRVAPLSRLGHPGSMSWRAARIQVMRSTTVKLGGTQSCCTVGRRANRSYVVMLTAARHLLNAHLWSHPVERRWRQVRRRNPALRQSCGQRAVGAAAGITSSSGLVGTSAPGCATVHSANPGPRAIGPGW